MDRINVRPKAHPLAGIFENVKLVIAAFNETENTLPRAQFSARTPAEIAGAVCFSISPVIVGVVSAGLVPSITAPVPLEVVTPVPPDKTASVAESPAAVPVLFWFKTGKSAAIAIDGAPVVVVFFSMPVASPDINTPLILTTVSAVLPVASPVCVALETRPL